MTALEMSKEFDVRYDNLTNNQGMGFTLWEKSILLTQAQENLVDRWKSYVDLNMEDKVNLSELKESVVLEPGTESSLTPRYTIPGTSTGWLVELPGNYFYTIHERTDISFEDTQRKACYPNGIKGVWTKGVSEDYFNPNIGNPFKKPYENLIWSIFYRRPSMNYVASDTNPRIIELVSDSDTVVENYVLSYLRRPVPVIIENLTGTKTVRGYQSAYDCELDSSVHAEIVQEAVRLAAGVTKDSDKYQIENLESNLLIQNRQ